MLVTIKSVLSTEEVAHFHAVLREAAWVDGNVTSGVQAARAKANLQVPEDAAQSRTLAEALLVKLGSNEEFNAAALPLRVYPPLFNRYDPGMGFASHVDNAIRFHRRARQRYRTDISTTLFLSDPADYDGGELVIEREHGEEAIKLAAGDLVLYPADSLHRVAPVTRGSRLAAFFWTQSMVREPGDRALLYRMDKSIGLARADLGDGHPAVLGLTSTFHNLLRKWADV